MASLVPTEVLHRIAECLPTSDIPSFRLTSRKWVEVGLEYLLHEVHLILTVESFDRLKRISLHPRLSRCVRSIFYESDAIADYTDLSDWAHAYRMLLSGPYSVAEIEASWPKYQEVYGKQKEILVDGRDEREVQEALLRFPRLASIRISNDSGLCSWTPYFVRSFQTDLFPVSVCRSSEAQKPAYFRQINSIVEVLMEWPASFTHLRILDMGTVSWELFCNTNTSWWKNDTLALLEEVKVLLSFCPAERDPTDILDDACREHLEREGSLVKFFSPMRHLKRLDISLDQMAGDYPFYANYAIGVDITWPELREITFGNLTFCDDEMITFLERHAQTLTVLTIKGLMLDTDDTWDRIVSRIRDVRSWEKLSIMGKICRDGCPDLWITEQ